MKLRIIEADLLSQTADAVVGTIDGLIDQPRVNVDRQLGNTGHQFMRRFPDAGLEQEIASQVDFPLRLGSAALVEIPEGTSPFRWAIVVSTLPHIGELDATTLKNAARSAFAHALELAHGAGVRTIATTILAGGWRLKPMAAWAAMLDVLRAPHKGADIELTVCVREEREPFVRFATQVGVSVK
jgi:hypothetical protein